MSYSSLRVQMSTRVPIRIHTSSLETPRCVTAVSLFLLNADVVLLDVIIIFKRLLQIEDMTNQAGYGQHLGAPSNAAAGLGGLTSAMANAKLGEKAEDDEDDLPDLEPVADSAKKDEEEEDDGEISEGDIDPKEIEVVMNQTNCSRKKAVKALKDSGGDLINASTSISSISRI